jgi:two-component system, cell cycle response regulator
LARVLRYAVERHGAQADVKAPSLTDKLTGLYNRKGFLTLAEQHLKMARRTKRGFFVFFAVLDGLNAINEAFGKSEGNQALTTTADILRESFRTSDVIARIGTDEFAIVTPEHGQYSPKILTARLQKSQRYYNAQYNRYRLSLSVCACHFDPQETASVRDLVQRADKIFREYKDGKHRRGQLVIAESRSAS